MTKLELIGQIADLKESEYTTNLLLASLIELLIEKNVLTREQISQKAQVLDLIGEMEAKARILEK